MSRNKYVIKLSRIQTYINIIRIQFNLLELEKISLSDVREVVGSSVQTIITRCFWEGFWSGMAFITLVYIAISYFIK